MIKRFFISMIVGTLIFTLTGCTAKESKSNEKIQVVATFNAMKQLAVLVGGDRIQVASLIEGNIEPHDFEPTSKEIKKVEDGDVFIYNGAGMDNWAEDVLKSAKNKIKVVEATKGIELLKLTDSDNEHGGYDPHIWHSLKFSQEAIKNIKDTLIEADSKNKDYYESNYNEAIKKMDALYNQYNEKFKTLNNKVFITGHEGFGYLCNDYGLKQIGIENAFASGDPSPARLKELTDICKENNVKVIFMEEQISPKLSETLAKEVGAKVEVIESMETEGEYLPTMESNLNKIYEALK